MNKFRVLDAIAAIACVVGVLAIVHRITTHLDAYEANRPRAATCQQLMTAAHNSSDSLYVLMNRGDCAK